MFIYIYINRKKKNSHRFFLTSCIKKRTEKDRDPHPLSATPLIYIYIVKSQELRLRIVVPHRGNAIRSWCPRKGPRHRPQRWLC